MFKYTIDNKRTVTDLNGNEIVNLQSSIFSTESGEIHDYEIRRISDHFVMRPDLVAQAVWSDTKYAEFILKFSGISNPFTLSDEDVLLIPNITQAEGMMSANNVETQDNVEENIAAIRNFFKFVNQEYKSDKSSYDALGDLNIQSGVIDKTKLGTNYIQPYISEDGRTGVTIRNGRMYFGGDTNQPVASGSQVSSGSQAGAMDAMIEQYQGVANNLLRSVNSPYSDTNCLHNGTLMTDFFKANVAKKD